MCTLTLLAGSPDWVIVATLYALTIGVLPFGRKVFEGYFYNVAKSSQWGDIALIFWVVVAAHVLRRQSVDAWLESSIYHVTVGLISLAAGIAFQVIMKADQKMDIYHNLIIVPLYVYLIAAIAVPITCLYGATVEIQLGFFLLAIWACLLVYDIITGRLDQRKWLAKQGYL